MADPREASDEQRAEGGLKTELAALAAIAAERLTGLELQERLGGAGIAHPAREVDALRERGLMGGSDVLELTPAGVFRLRELHAAVEAALDPSPTTADREECPSLPWLTTVTTEWIEALSLNYAVDAAALAPLLPAPVEPELWKGTAWVQVLVSSLREMRPQGAPRLFGQNFYQVSYRAAVQYRTPPRRGGYFVRSETSDPVMREVGNALAEFRFHEFGLSDIVLLRDGAHLTLGVEPREGDGRIVAIVDTTPLEAPPAGSAWASLDELHEPLVECYDALGVDRDAGWLYVLTIDREPWRARFVRPREVYCEWMTETGPLAGHARLDSVLHVPRCAYRWRPLRRERL